MTPNEYKQRMLPYANRAAAELQMPPEVILSQWALESGNGSSNFAKNYNNHGGIKFSQYSKTASKIPGSSFAKYGSIDAFVTDYIRVLKLKYYDSVRSAGSIEDTVRRLGDSPYDAGHYTLDGVPGGKLLKMLGISLGKPKPPKVCPTCQRPL